MAGGQWPVKTRIREGHGHVDAFEFGLLEVGVIHVLAGHRPLVTGHLFAQLAFLSPDPPAPPWTRVTSRKASSRSIGTSECLHEYIPSLERVFREV